MNLHDYRKRRAELDKEAANQFRELCFACFQPSEGCYCEHIKKFDPQIKFVILIHPIERKRRIATGRMTHLCLENSELIIGEDYSNDTKVNSILEDEHFHSVMLYPGRNAVDISKSSPEVRSAHFPKNKKLAVFVIDGTWNTARKMIRSENLKDLPKICFTPSAPSNFRVRKQPAEGCVSTIEAVHETIELIGMHFGFETTSRKHDNLLYVFDQLVETQLKYIREVRSNRHASAV